MKFHLEKAEGRNLFTGYGDGYVTVNHQRFERPVLVTPDAAVHEWDAPGFDALTPAHFEALLQLKPEIVIFGTGAALRFPRPELTRTLAAAGVGLEVMDTKAACRTYNILMAEGRQVLAAVLL
jgi:uncharacterized protein